MPPRRNWSHIDEAVDEFYRNPHNEGKIPAARYKSPTTGFTLGDVLHQLRKKMKANEDPPS
jgi:hypothetical protein